MSIRFDEQVALVTGSGRGLGAAYIRLLADRGAAVMVHDAGVAADGSGLDPSVADAVAADIRQQGGVAAADYQNLESAEGCHALIASTIDRFGRLDVLIHNAGLVVWAEVEQVDELLWRRMVNIGVHAPFHLIQATLPHMRRNQYGRIVLTTSDRALHVAAAAPGLTAYSVGKMAQLGLMVSVAAETEDQNIEINAISPVAATRVLRRSAPELLPEQVAPGVAFLASSQCNFSGVILQAAGGRFATARWSFSTGVDLGVTPADPETIAARWAEICAPSH